MFRATLGSTGVARAVCPGLVRPPCQQAGCGNPRCDHVRHDSLVTDVPGLRFREFVVFERALSYPELIIKYRRVV